MMQSVPLEVVVLAHQGGWDEALMVLIPGLAAIYALRWAARKAQQRDDAGRNGDAAASAPAGRTTKEPSADE